MRKVKSIIELVSEGNAVNTQARTDFVQITGQEYWQTYFYRNLENGEEYLHLAGGFAWPGKKPGFGLLLAAMRGPENRPVKFKALEEVENKHVETVLLKCADLREKYTPGLDRGYLDFYGDSSHVLSPMIQKKNMQQDERDTFYLIDPNDFDRADSFKLYVSEIFGCGKRGELDLGNCERLRGYIENSPDDEDIFDESAESQPAMAALGYVLHSLTMNKPWLVYAPRIAFYT